MKNKLLSILEKNIINVSTLIVLLTLVIFISNSINNYTFFKLVETSYNLPKDYNTFMTNYYQTQSNWLIFWLTLLACLTAIIGLAIPFVLNLSYRDKIKEMEKEFQKQLKDLDNYKKQSAESLKILKNDVKLMKTQAEQSKQALPKMFTKEFSNFKKNMQDAIDDVKQNAIIFEIENLQELNSDYCFNNKREEELQTLNKIIHIAESAKKQFPEANLFKDRINIVLREVYYSRGLNFQYCRKEYNNAVLDYSKSKELRPPCVSTEVIDKCLLYCYVKLNKLKECSELLNSMDSFYRRDVCNVLDALEENCSNEAKELIERINGKIKKLN